MNWALYHPQYGYYTRQRQKIGAKGDFFTSPHLAVDFGELIAEQLVEMWQVLGKPVPFTLVEMGAGQGLLANDILNYLEHRYPECCASIQYLIVETAKAHIAEQRSRLQRWVTLELSAAGSSPSEPSIQGPSIQWCELDDIPRDSITGCFFSNELIDAFPVHVITVQNHQLKEVYVTTDHHPDHTSDRGSFSSSFVEVIDDCSTPDLISYFGFTGVDISTYETGYRTEVNLAALDWMRTVAERLHRGYVLTIDYGYTAERYYNWARSQGTLQCYYQHSYHSDPYSYIGEQDITAHVDFTALQRQGEQWGLETLGFTSQGLFLMALGLGQRLTRTIHTETTSPQDFQERLSRRDALHQLMNPMGLGGFGVLVQGKGLKLEERFLTGLREDGRMAG
jgi:SAM-dependent MidA family methyltransferase